MSLDERLDQIVAARDRDHMRPTVEALLEVLREHPDVPRVLYEVGGAYDTAGEEETARTYYERALEAGLSDDLLRRCYLQHGSTLRNLGLHAESLALFARARREFPDSPSLAVFEALSLHAAGEPDLAVATLLDVVADAVQAPDLERYKPAIRGNAAYVRSLADDRPGPTRWRTADDDRSPDRTAGNGR